ncbi:MAG: serine protease, partial [Deltaproteobacteria bacterium]
WLFVGAVPSLLGPVGPPVGPPAAPEAQALVAALAGPRGNTRAR